MKQVCSLGGGKASTAMFLMSLHGDIDAKVDVGIWADTGWEPSTTHNTIAKLTEYAKGFGVEIHTVRGKIDGYGIRQAMLNPDSRHGQMPMFTKNEQGKIINIGRYCTGYFKVDPIRRWIRSELGATFKKPVNMWLGYTVDECMRMKPSNKKYEVRRYPLIEHRISRRDCLSYLEKYGWNDVERSACVGCPYRLDSEYDILNETEKKELEEFETSLNDNGYKMAKSDNVEVRLHRSMTPITEKPYENNNTQIPLFDLCGGASCLT